VRSRAKISAPQAGYAWPENADLSIGDFVLSGGELAAAVIVDTIARSRLNFRRQARGLCSGVNSTNPQADYRISQG
jgi:hypothetical protein